jgi:hypothetical protein
MLSMKHKRSKADVAVATSQAAPVHATCWMLLPLLLGLLLASANSAATRQAEDLDATIQHLITYVRESDVTFERNFSRHDSDEAAVHIENKYQHFRDEIDTPEQFIELCATASLVTGKQYMIIDGQGETIPAGEWLNIELARYRLQNAQ